MTTQLRSPHEQVAEEVRALLARRRMSGRAAARQLGWTSDYMHRRLDGRTAFDVNDVTAIARLLDVPISALFAGLDSRDDQTRKTLIPDLDKPITQR
ncbi:helix-turn-helix domain-containing protein [Actinomadura geliboluensis]|uniref:helix-turn-helix domain-containing protein n=1 Tax=Actinomadura geliboluensis TaxID=882440 RepID=UPI00262F4AEC|nr:helix-turn-helix transcriptional regulator [Actinomadura geliboluensis]